MQAAYKITGTFGMEDKYRIIRVEQKLEQINYLVDWGKVISFIKKIIPSNGTMRGRRRKDLLLRVKILFLQYLYDLSDNETEDLMKDRLSFMKFAEIDNGRTTLDFNIIWQFREQLFRFKCYEQLLLYVTGLLADKGFVINKGNVSEASAIDLKIINNV